MWRGERDGGDVPHGETFCAKREEHVKCTRKKGENGKEEMKRDVECVVNSTYLEEK